jgi:PKD domain
MLSAAVVRPVTTSVPASEISPVVRVTNTLNESTNTLSTRVTPAPTLTVTGTNGGDATAPTPVITVLGDRGDEPHSVFVHALDSTLGAGTCLTARYQWDFGDPGSEYNDLVGWNAAHTYQNPGTYTITLTLTNQLGKTRILSTNVTIGQAHYRSIYVNSISGNDSNSGFSMSFPVRSAARALQLAGNNTQILFKTGETFPVYSSMNLPYKNIFLGSYGTGSQPVLMREPGMGTSIIGTFDSSSNVMIEGLTFNSPWSSRSLTAPKIPADGIFPGGTDITIRNCTFLNLDDAINESRNPQGVLIQDCTAPLQTGLRGCFLWGQDRKGDKDIYFQSFFGRPRGRNEACRFSSSEVVACQIFSPNGRPRLIDSRSSASSLSVCGSLTRSSQSAGRMTGHSLRIPRSCGDPFSRRQRLDHCQFSARRMSRARNALRSTYRATVRKCRSSCTGKLLYVP